MLKAQSNFKPGFIVNNTGDTIYGSIDYRGNMFMGEYCIFKDSNNVKHKYTSQDILAYRFIDNRYFVSREINNKKVFLEYLVKGKISFLYLKDLSGEIIILKKKDFKLLKYLMKKESDMLTTNNIFTNPRNI